MHGRDPGLVPSGVASHCASACDLCLIEQAVSYRHNRPAFRNNQKHPQGATMPVNLINRPVRRRTILKAGLAIGAMQVASPFVVKSLADEPIKIGLDNPLTGTFAALGKNELIGCQLAVDQITPRAASSAARWICWSRTR